MPAVCRGRTAPVAALSGARRIRCGSRRGAQLLPLERFAGLGLRRVATGTAPLQAVGAGPAARGRTGSTGQGSVVSRWEVRHVRRGSGSGNRPRLRVHSVHIWARAAGGVGGSIRARSKRQQTTEPNTRMHPTAAARWRTAAAGDAETLGSLDRDQRGNTNTVRADRRDVAEVVAAVCRRRSGSRCGTVLSVANSLLASAG